MSESDRVQRWRQRQREAGKKPRTIWLTDEENLRLEDMALTRRCSPSELVQQALALLRGESLPVTDIVTDTEQIRAIVQQELAQTHIGTATVTDTVTATLQQTLPALVRALLAAQHEGSVPATVTDTVTDTSLSSRPAPRMDTAPGDVTATVTATGTDTMTSPGADHTPETVSGRVTATITDTVTDTGSAPPAKHKVPLRQRPAADTVADTIAVTEPKHRGRKPVLREPILALLREHQAGLSAAELKVYLQTEKPIGDTLSGMVRAKLLVRQGSGQGLRYVLSNPD